MYHWTRRYRRHPRQSYLVSHTRPRYHILSLLGCLWNEIPIHGAEQGVAIGLDRRRRDSGRGGQGKHTGLEKSIGQS
jgi:hypothetical protein